MALTFKQILLCVGMLITGSINTLSKKAQNDCSAPGYPDSKNVTSRSHQFNHPWFQTIIMFIGEMTCLFGLCYIRWKERRLCMQAQNDRLMVSPAISGNMGTSRSNAQNNRIFQWIFAIPTVFDLIGTSIAGIGLLYVDASVWQMLRGSIIIFTGVFSKFFLKRKLRALQWLGIMITVIGLILVGLSSILREKKHADTKIMLGIILIVTSQIVSAGQMIVEELFLKSKGYHPLQVVGMEGTFGFVIMAAVVLPAMYFIHDKSGNIYENSLDAIYQIGNDYKLLIFSILYLISIAFYNYFGLAVTKSLTAVHRTLIDACRTISVWIVNLLIFYIFKGDFGESFDRVYGIFQVDGFLFLLLGTAFYNELMDVPCIPCLKKTPVETYPSLIDSAAISGAGSIQRIDAAENERTPLLADERTPSSFS